MILGVPQQLTHILEDKETSALDMLVVFPPIAEIPVLQRKTQFLAAAQIEFIKDAL